MLQGVSRPKLLELASCAYLNQAEDVILAGPIGTGKTHIAIGLGVEAARRRFHVSFTRAAELVRMLLEVGKGEKILLIPVDVIVELCLRLIEGKITRENLIAILEEAISKSPVNAS